MLITFLTALVALIVGYRLGKNHGKQEESYLSKMKLLDIPGLKIAAPSQNFLHADQKSAWDIGITLGDKQVDWLGTVIVIYGPDPYIFKPDNNPVVVKVDADSVIGSWTFYPPSWLLPFYEGMSPRGSQKSASRYVRKEAASHMSD